MPNKWTQLISAAPRCLLHYLKEHRGLLLSSALLFACSFLLLALVHNVTGFGPWYSHYVYPLLPNTLGRLLSLLPFSLFELLICLAIVLAVGFLLFFLFALWSRGGRKRLTRAAGGGIPVLACILAAMFFIQTLTCFLNYERVDFPEEIGLAVYPATDADLEELCLLLISDLDDLIADDSAPLHFDANGSMSLDNINIGAQAKQSMKKLGETYPSLSGYYPNPKPIFFSRAMSTVSLTGIFSPYTTEANYNKDVTPYVIPYTICHELAHVKGYIKENEAGFIAYLACSGSDSPQLRYSGALNALSYSLNALYRSVSPEEYQTILRQVPEQALHDLQRNQAYWQEFRQGVRGTISETARAANDTYLRANAQSDGAKSYGRMVDLLLAYYKIGAEEL